jgi:general stress protein YciG
MPEKNGKSRRGFAAMDQAKQREIASKGGQASGGNFKNNPARASEAGRKGGERSQSGGNRIARAAPSAG